MRKDKTLPVRFLDLRWLRRVGGVADHRRRHLSYDRRLRAGDEDGRRRLRHRVRSAHHDGGRRGCGRHDGNSGRRGSLHSTVVPPSPHLQ